MTTSPLYLLDTNVLIHFVRGSAVWDRIRDAYHPLTAEPQPIVSVVSAGEIRSLATQWNWGKQKLDQMEFALNTFELHTILDAAIIEMYATIDAYCESIGQSLGKNDLWIAATAAITGATLLTTDHDFDRLSPRFLARAWIDPDTKSAS